MIYLVASGVLFLIIDQASKRLIELRFADRPADCGPFLRIRRVSNSHRLYRRSGFRVALVVVWTAAFASALILSGRGSFTGVPAAIGVGAALGGALGNLLDIIRTKSVRDFIDLGWWPVFNVADVAIIGGLATAFLRH